MAGAAEEAVGLADGAVRLKWPNDLVIEPASGLVGTRRDWPGGSGADAAAATDGSSGREAEETGYRKLGGVLGETIGLGSPEPVVIVGLGVNADWPAEEFPPPLAAGMTSLREAGGGRPVDRAGLLEAFLSRLATRVEALRSGHFDVAEWTARQLVQGRVVRLERPDGSEEQVRVRGVDAETGTPLRQGVSGRC
jgi:biotin-(acetyl-CoA carboxylase) ligase